MCGQRSKVFGKIAVEQLTRTAVMGIQPVVKPFDVGSHCQLFVLDQLRQQAGSPCIIDCDQRLDPAVPCQYRGIIILPEMRFQQFFQGRG